MLRGTKSQPDPPPYRDDRIKTTGELLGNLHPTGLRIGTSLLNHLAAKTSTIPTLL